MALIFCDGFDHYGTSPNGGRDAMLAGAWSEVSASSAGNFQVSNAQSRTGTYSLYANSQAGTGGGFIRRAFGSGSLNVGFAFGIYLAQLPGSNTGAGMTFRNASNSTLYSLTWMSNGSIAVRSGNESGTILAQTDPILAPATWNHIEIHFNISTTVGSIEIRVNGITEVLATGLNLGSTGIAGVAFHRFVSNTSNTTAFYVDDLVVWDNTGSTMNDFIGPCRVETLFPSADTAQADWTPNGASDGYDCIDNVPPDGDTTYISAADEGMISDFEITSLSPEADIIEGVYVVNMGKLSEAGDGSIQASLVYDGEVAEGTSRSLTTAYTYRADVLSINPKTGNKWTPAALNAALLRLEKTA